MYPTKRIYHLGLYFLLSYLLFGTPDWQKPFAASQTISSLSEGQPEAMGKMLGEKSYAPVEAKRLTKPRVLWLNIPYLREHGFAIPESGITPELENQILDAFAWGVPGEMEPKSAFKPNEVKTFFADRYGGSGLATNWGSGRAASAGQIQIKGIGKTDLVGTDLGTGLGHSNGMVPGGEALREPIFGEINSELPLGSNRVIALIDRGTTQTLKNGTIQPNVNIVREDPLRPAHYVRAWYGQGPQAATEKARLKEAIKFLPNALPSPEGSTAKTNAEKIKEGINEFTDRYAKQQAAAFAQKLYHGGTSLSNIEISGKFLDYGTETAQPGYAPLQVIGHIEPSGEIKDFKEVIIQGLAEDVKSNVPANLQGAIPDSTILKRRFTTKYNEALRHEFLLLTGVPENLVTELENTPEGKKLAAELMAVATKDAKKFTARFDVPEKVSAYDLGEILTKLTNEKSPVDIDKILKTEIPGKDGAEIRRSLADAYSSFMKKALLKAERDGVSEKALQTLVAESARARNKKIPDAYRWKMMDELEPLIEKYAKNGDRDAVWSTIDNKIANSRRIFKTPDPYHFALSEKVLIDGTKEQEIYDARTGTRRTIQLGNIDCPKLFQLIHK
jgi:hypothetical protein